MTEKKIETVAELMVEQEKLRKQLNFYNTRFVRLRELESLEAKVAELDARLAKVEKK